MEEAATAAQIRLAPARYADAENVRSLVVVIPVIAANAEIPAAAAAAPTIAESAIDAPAHAVLTAITHPATAHVAAV